jgi:hypothetical protein
VDASIDVRVTSVSADGNRQITPLTMEHRRRGDVSRLEVAIAPPNQSRRVFCLKCGASGITETCEEQTATYPALDEFIPGTVLPWHVPMIGFCRRYNRRELQPASGSAERVVELVPSHLGPREARFTLRVHLSSSNGPPSKIVRLDALDREQWVIDILEVRRTAWGLVATRSMYRDTSRGSRVLIEVRGGRVIGPGQGTPQPTPPDGGRSDRITRA